jgi:hypothetical protein
MTLEELLLEHKMANSELTATRSKFEEVNGLQQEHNKMMLEYSIKSRDLSSEVKIRENKVLRLAEDIRKEKVKQDTEKETQQVQELKESQPTFWEVTANCLDEVIAGSYSGIDLTFAPERKASDMMKGLKQLTDTSLGYGIESSYLYEAKKQFEEVMTKICLDQIKGRGYSAHRTKQLKHPILQLLNNQRIKSVIQLS